MIRRGRETLGFSQARLGELVGRSASTIRNWERGKSTPSVAADAVALAAVLGLDERRVVEAAGFEPSEVETHQTVEQAYASLAPTTGMEPDGAVERVEPDEPEEEAASPEVDRPDAHVPEAPEHPPTRSGFSWPPGPVPEPVADPTPEPDTVSEGEEAPREEPESPPPAPTRDPEPSPGREDTESHRHRRPPVPPSRRLIAVPPAEPARDPETPVARAAPPTVLEATPAAEPSYVEDPDERQRYRVRAVATAAVVLFLFLVLLWSFDRATDALGTMWDEFIGMLEL